MLVAGDLASIAAFGDGASLSGELGGGPWLAVPFPFAPANKAKLTERSSIDSTTRRGSICVTVHPAILSPRRALIALSLPGVRTKAWASSPSLTIAKRTIFGGGGGGGGAATWTGGGAGRGGGRRCGANKGRSRVLENKSRGRPRAGCWQRRAADRLRAHHSPPNRGRAVPAGIIAKSASCRPLPPERAQSVTRNGTSSVRLRPNYLLSERSCNSRNTREVPGSNCGFCRESQS